MHRIDVSNLDKLKPLCGIINGFILVILQEFKDSNRKIQEVVSQSKLRGGFLSAIEHISRYFESDREATVIELKNCVDADMLCKLLNETKREDIDISDAKSVTFITYLVRLVGLWTSDMAIVPFVDRGILNFCFYTIQKYSSERVSKMSKYLSDTLQTGEICALSNINEFCDKLRANERALVGRKEMSSLQTLQAMVRGVRARSARILKHFISNTTSVTVHQRSKHRYFMAETWNVFTKPCVESCDICSETQEEVPRMRFNFISTFWMF